MRWEGVRELLVARLRKGLCMLARGGLVFLGAQSIVDLGA